MLYLIYNFFMQWYNYDHFHSQKNFSLPKFFYRRRSEIKFEIKIVLIEFIQPNEPILSATSERFPIRMECQAVNGTEMASDPSEFFFENQMVEFRFETTLGRQRLCYLHCLFTTAQYDVVSNWRN